MKVLVFEAAAAGHYLQWAGQVAVALSDVGVNVILGLSQDAVRSPTFQFHIEPYRDHFSVDASIVPNDSQKSPAINAITRLRSLRSLIRRHNPSRVYIPTADGIAQLLGLIGSFGRFALNLNVPTEGLIMNGAVANRNPPTSIDHLRQLFSFRLAKAGGWSRFFHLNPLVRDWEIRRGSSPTRAVLTMPEPVEASILLTKTEARKRLRIPIDGRYLGIVGRLDTRKGADRLIEAFSSAKLGVNDRLLMVGPVASDVQKHVAWAQLQESLNERFIVRNEVVTDEVFLTSINALDLVVLPYQNVGSSSGIVVRAASSCRPILITPGGWGETMVNRFDLGWVLPNNTLTSLTENLPHYLDASLSWHRTPKGDRFSQYNSIPNFAAHWTQGIRELLMVPQSAALRSWEWVTPQREEW